MRLNFIGQTISFTELTSKVSDDVTVISLENMKLEGGEDDLLKLSKVIRGTILEKFAVQKRNTLENVLTSSPCRASFSGGILIHQCLYR